MVWWWMKSYFIKPCFDELSDFVGVFDSCGIKMDVVVWSEGFFEKADVAFGSLPHMQWVSSGDSRTCCIDESGFFDEHIDVIFIFELPFVGIDNISATFFVAQWTVVAACFA